MPRVLGLDLGSYSLKGVLLESTGRGTSVLRWAETRRAEDAPLDEALAVFLAENAWAPDQVVVALPGPSLATHVFTLPFTDPKRIAATLPFEVEGELPFELSQVVFDHQVTRRRANATDLIVGLVRREELAELLKTLAAPRSRSPGGDPPRHRVPEPVPRRARAVRGGARGRAGRDRHRPPSDQHRGGPPGRGPALRPDLPGRRSRSVPGAGRRVPGSARRGGGVDGARRLPGPGRWTGARAGPCRAPEGAGAPRAGDAGHLEGGIRAGARSGGAAAGSPAAPRAFPGLVEHLGTELGLPADLLLLPAVATPVVPPEIQPRAAEAYALALRGAMSSGRAPRFNLRQGDFAFRGHVDYLRERLVRVAAFAAVLALLLCVFNVTRAILLGRREAAVDARLCALTQRVLGSCEKNFDRALNMLRGQQSPAAAVPSVSTTRLLAEVAQRVPPDITVTFGQMVFDLDRVQLRGRPTPRAASTSSPRR